LWITVYSYTQAGILTTELPTKNWTSNLPLSCPTKHKTPAFAKRLLAVRCYFEILIFSQIPIFYFHFWVIFVAMTANLFIDSLFSLLFAFFSRMGECLSRLFFKSVRCQTKVNFSLRSVWCWFEFKYSFFLCNLWLFLFSHSSIFFVLRFPFYYLIIVWKHSLRNNFYRSTFCWRFTAENLKILSVLVGCHFF